MRVEGHPAPVPEQNLEGAVSGNTHFGNVLETETEIKQEIIIFFIFFLICDKFCKFIDINKLYS